MVVDFDNVLTASFVKPAGQVELGVIIPAEIVGHVRVFYCEFLRNLETHW
jgi:hypothetical protein